jgi:hypothetical protein
MDVAHPEPQAQAGERTASPRDRLIEAATWLFCRYGVNSVGVDEIIAAAGTAKTTLYRLFRSKDGLLQCKCPLLAAGSTGHCNTARSLSAGVSKPKVFRGR